MPMYIKPRLRSNLSAASENLVSDLILSIVGQIRVFEGKSIRPGAIYGISRCLRMIHEHFEAGYTKESEEYLIDLELDTQLRTIREVYSLSRKIDKSNRKLYVEHTDGGVKKLTVQLLGLYEMFKGNEEDVLMVRRFIIDNTYFIIKHKEKNKDINENFLMKNLINR